MPHRVLICDDEFHIRSVLGSALRRAGLEVMEARDGKDGADLALASPPDLVITDLQMPRASGMDLCERLSGDARTRGLPILMLSARGHVLEEEQMRRVGIRRLIPKPFSAKNVVKLALDILSEGKGRMAAA